MKNHITEQRIAIIGCGPVGMITALELHRAGFSPILIGRFPKANDQRTTAIMTSNEAFLTKIGLWQKIAQKAAALRHMKLCDATERLIRSPNSYFSAKEIGQELFGYNCENNVINQILIEEIKHKEIQHIDTNVINYELKEEQDQNICYLENGENIAVDLILAADGKNSAARQAANIKVKSKNYPQSAMVLTFHHELSHNDCSTEIHTVDGPFTQVPLPQNNSSLIWTVAKQQTAELQDLSLSQLANLIEEKIGALLGKVEITNKPQIWPLSCNIAEIFAKKAVFLLGESAHSFPPIGAQGLNLSLRDISSISEILTKNIKQKSKAELCAKYHQARESDVKLRALCVEKLNHSLLSPAIGWQIARFTGLSLLNQSNLVRRFFMQQGLAPTETILKLANRLL